jgi:glycine/D-amino acid oxidase-like deaminating enzyme
MMRETPARETCAAEMHTAAHAAEVHGRGVHPSCHAAMHPAAAKAMATTAKAMATAAKTTTAVPTAKTTAAVPTAKTTAAVPTAPATAAVATSASTASTAATASERRRRQGKRHTQRARDEAPNELVVHRKIPPRLNCSDGYRRSQRGERNVLVISNDKCDSF